jgi:hypothetical protein
MKGKQFFSLLAVALVSLSLISARNAYRYTIDLDNHLTWLAADNPCGFDIEYAEEGTLFGIVWFEGGQIKQINEVSANIRNTLTVNDKTLRIGYATTHTFILSEDKLVVRFLGKSDFVTVPGYGQVWGGAGLGELEYIYDPVKDEWIEGEQVKLVGLLHFYDFSPICKYLAP